MYACVYAENERERRVIADSYKNFDKSSYASSFLVVGRECTHMK